MPGWTLEGLKSALTGAGIDPDKWTIAYRKADLAEANEVYGLFDEGGFWTVAYGERGKWNELARFRQQSEAIRYFWWRMTDAPVPFE
jgi:hypothetical protein